MYELSVYPIAMNLMALGDPLRRLLRSAPTRVAAETAGTAASQARSHK
jgi:hypothetical protein